MSRTRHQQVGSSNTNRIILYFSKKALTSAFFLLSILSSVKKRWHSLKLSEQLHQIRNMYCFLGIDYTLAPRTILDNSFIEYEKDVVFFRSLMTFIAFCLRHLPYVRPGNLSRDPIIYRLTRINQRR